MVVAADDTTSTTKPGTGEAEHWRTVSTNEDTRRRTKAGSAVVVDPELSHNNPPRYRIPAHRWNSMGTQALYWAYGTQLGTALELAIFSNFSQVLYFYISICTNLHIILFTYCSIYTQGYTLWNRKVTQVNILHELLSFSTKKVSHTREIEPTRRH